MEPFRNRPGHAGTFQEPSEPRSNPPGALRETLGTFHKPLGAPRQVRAASSREIGSDRKLIGSRLNRRGIGSGSNRLESRIGLGISRTERDSLRARSDRIEIGIEVRESDRIESDRVQPCRCLPRNRKEPRDLPGTFQGRINPSRNRAIAREAFQGPSREP